MNKTDFYWSNEREPHLNRRKLILQKYPEVRSLIGPDIKLAVTTILLVLFQLISAFFIHKLLELPFGVVYFILAVYFIGATFTHSLFLAIHEITHNLAFKGQTPNNWLALFANLPIVFPYAMGFKVYHTMHHRHQGVDGVDVDVPTYTEAKIFKGVFGKTIWAFIQILFYAFRPMFVHPKKLNKWQIINLIFQISLISVYIYFAGWYALLYLVLADFIAGSLHPMSGHFIAEHIMYSKRGRRHTLITDH